MSYLEDLGYSANDPDAIDDLIDSLQPSLHDEIIDALKEALVDFMVERMDFMDEEEYHKVMDHYELQVDLIEE